MLFCFQNQFFGEIKINGPLDRQWSFICHDSCFRLVEAKKGVVAIAYRTIMISLSLAWRQLSVQIAAQGEAQMRGVFRVFIRVAFF